MSKLVYVGVAFNVLWLTGLPVYWYVTGKLPDELFDKSDPAAMQIAKWVFMNNELAQGIIMRSQIFLGLSLPALVNAPRAYRVLPCLFMVFWLMYSNTYRQNQLVLEATGKPNPMISNVIHSTMSIVYVAVIVLPDIKKGKAAASCMSRLIYAGVAFSVLFLTGLPTYWYVTGKLPDEVFDKSDPAAMQIAKWVFMNNELAQGIIMRSQIFLGLSMPALLVTVRAYRVLPCLFMVFWLMYCNTYRQNQLVLAATGKPNPMISNVVHSIMAMVYLAAITFKSSPDTGKGKTD